MNKRNTVQRARKRAERQYGKLMDQLADQESTQRRANDALDRVWLQHELAADLRNAVISEISNAVDNKIDVSVSDLGYDDRCDCVSQEDIEQALRSVLSEVPASQLRLP